MKKFFYRVGKDDSVLSLAERFNALPTVIIKDNAISEEIKEGDVLFIEETDGKTYTVQPFDTFQSVGEKFNVSPERIAEINGVPYLFYGLKIIIPE